ncbi:MAG: hypothetical protein JWO02_1013, partial [Solirubrobacterales bacterium]|nr:hypothetical protein [Solirubrobacterales bacterium]
MGVAGERSTNSLSQRHGRGRRLPWSLGALMASGLLAIALLLLGHAGGAGAAAQGCQTGSLTFSFTGGEQCYVVPAGITTLHVTARGAPGGAGQPGATTAPGGSGAITDGDIAVVPGTTLYVEVGGAGDSHLPSGSVAAFNGGGAAGNSPGGSTNAGGGGGASDVRTCVSSGLGCVGTTLASRLIVAGGGGGGGGDGLGSPAPVGGAGGAAGTDAGGGAMAGADATGTGTPQSGGGQPGTSGAGGL